MNLYIFKIHPDVEECDGMLVVRAESYKQAYELLVGIRNEDVFNNIENPNFGKQPFIYEPKRSIHDHIPRNHCNQSSAFWQPIWCLVGELALADVKGSEGEPIIFKSEVLYTAYRD